MRARFHLGLLAAALLLAAGPAVAQEAAPQPGPAKPEWVKPPAKLPHVGGDPSKNLDFLFGALKAAPDASIAKAIEERIWAVWAVSRSDTANLLMLRARTALTGKDSDLAIKLLTAIIKIKPDYVEAWNERATLYYTRKDYGRALADIREVLKREPRHFGALAGLGQVELALGNKAAALNAFDQALAIDPYLGDVPKMAERLRKELAGKPI